VEAIAHRLDKVSEGPWIAWDRGIGYEIHGPQGEPVNDRHRATFSKGDAEFIAMAPGDVHFLLAELRKAREALARVEALHQRVEGYIFGAIPGAEPDWPVCSICFTDDERPHAWPCPTMAAVAAAKGDGE
jgi:hypothetical protein